MKKLVLIVSLFLSTSLFSQEQEYEITVKGVVEKGVISGYFFGKVIDEAFREAERIRAAKERLQREGERERARILRESRRRREHRDPPSDRMKPPRKTPRNNDASAGWRRA